MRTREQDLEFQRLWTRAVETNRYDKAQWRALEMALYRCDGSALDALLSIARLLAEDAP